MNKMLPILGLLVGLAGGWLGASQILMGEDSGDLSGDVEARLEAAERERDELEYELREVSGEKSRLASELEDLRETMLDKSRRLEVQDALIAGLEAQKAELEGKLVDESESQEEIAKRAMELFAKLKEMPFAGALSPTTNAKLISDLRDLGDAGVEGLLNLLGSEDKQERLLAVSLLGQLGDPASVDALRDVAMAEEDPMMAAMSSRSLMLMECEEAVPALQDLAKNAKNEGARVNSMFGLLRHGADGSVEMAAAYLADENSKHRRELGSSLFLLTGNKEIYPHADKYFEEYANSGNEQLGTMAVTYYASIDSPEARQRLVMLRDSEKHGEDIRRMAREALEK